LLNLIHYFKVITTKQKPVVSYSVYLHLYSPVTGSLCRPLKDARTVVLWSQFLTNCLHASKRGETMSDRWYCKTNSSHQWAPILQIHDLPVGSDYTKWQEN